MLIRFPESTPGFDKKHAVSFGNVPYALLSVKEIEGKKNVFLTQNALLFILQGKKIIHLPDNPLYINEEQLVILKRGLHVFSEYIPEGGSFEALVIFIPDSFCKKITLEHVVPALAKPAYSQPYFIISSNELLNNFKIHYKSYFGQSLNNLQYILDIKLQELFLLLTSRPDKNELLRFMHSLVVDKLMAIDFIVQQYLFQPVTINELAQLSGRSLAAFKRDFQAFYSYSPRQWINRERLKRAKLLLINSRKNVAEIAFECGYESVSHFIRLFKQTYGITPANSRKQQVVL